MTNILKGLFTLPEPSELAILNAPGKIKVANLPGSISFLVTPYCSKRNTGFKDKINLNLKILVKVKNNFQ